MRRDEDYTALVGQHVQLVVTECSGRKIVGSINKVTAEQNKAKREEFWANVEDRQELHRRCQEPDLLRCFCGHRRRGWPVPHQRAELEPHQASL